MSAGRPFLRRRLLWAATLALPVGCSYSDGPRPDTLAARILPSVDTTSTPPARPELARRDRAPAPPNPVVVQTRADQAAAASGDGQSAGVPTPAMPAEVAADGRSVCQPLPLPDAIATAFRLQPRLRVFLETVE